MPPHKYQMAKQYGGLVARMGHAQEATGSQCMKVIHEQGMS